MISDLIYRQFPEKNPKNILIERIYRVKGSWYADLKIRKVYRGWEYTVLYTIPLDDILEKREYFEERT